MNYLKIEECESNNGLGFGVTLFVSGCYHQCDGCFNKQSWNRKAGKVFADHTLRELFACLEKDYISRLTFSGGDPLALYNRNKVLWIAKQVRERFGDKIKLWCYTGYEKHVLQYDYKGGGSWGTEDRDLINGFLSEGKTDSEGGRTVQEPETGTENGFFYYFTEYFDYLVDGKYRKNETHFLPYRGSDNQRIYHKNYMGVWEIW